MNERKARIAVLVSGGGTNLQALIDAQRQGKLPHGEIVLVVSNKEGAYALTRASEAGIPALTVTRKQAGGQEAFETAILRALKEYRTDMVVLAGFLSILSADFVAEYPNRILNVHPSLIPAFCGEGYYGLRVHRAALERGVKVTGATVHFVNPHAARCARAAGRHARILTGARHAGGGVENPARRDRARGEIHRERQR